MSETSTQIFLKTHKKKPKKSIPCCICGNYFQPANKKSKYCGNKECIIESNRRRARERSEREAREDFAHGKIWVLDMETFEWHLEVRL